MCINGGEGRGRGKNHQEHFVHILGRNVKKLDDRRHAGKEDAVVPVVDKRPDPLHEILREIGVLLQNADAWEQGIRNGMQN